MATSRIPIGPQHPALKEPESFLISLNGERITDVAMRLGTTTAASRRPARSAATSRTSTS